MSNKAVDSLLVLLMLVSSTVPAEVFKSVDSQGRPHYSDRRRDNAEILSVTPGVSYYFVEKVFDGDTILLADGQKVRLLGVNTPEVAGRNKAAEPGGDAAKAWLKQRLEHKRVRLEFDVEKQDKYMRTLAYVFSEDQRHINEELVRGGFAAVNIYPPNLKYVDTLMAAQQNAEQAEMGIWRDRAYAARGFETLNAENYKGWKRISGAIQTVKKTRKYSYLQFSGQVAVRIENKSLNLFPALRGYIGKRVEARGWVIKNKDRFVLPVRHPGELKVM
jgi:Micrococcal nuclease (thermonuclease) homologs